LAVHFSPGVKTLVAILCGLMVALPDSAPAGPGGEPAPALVALAVGGAPPEPAPFRHQMMLTDRVKTGNRAFARLLLGGRVMVLARERSSLTFTEVPGAATIDIAAGRIAVTVDRGNLHPEHLVEVRTPHAVVSVQGSTLVVEVAGTASSFRAMGGRIDVFRRDPATGRALDPPTVVSADGVLTVGPAPMPTDLASR
jgi:hypothetical protein